MGQPCDDGLLDERTDHKRGTHPPKPAQDDGTGGDPPKAERQIWPDGKKILARICHRISPRASNPLAQMARTTRRLHMSVFAGISPIRAASPALVKMQRAGMLRAIVVVLAFLFIGLAMKLYHDINMMRRADNPVAAWKFTQFAVDYRDLQIASGAAKHATRIWPNPDSATAIAQLRLAVAQFDAGMDIAFAELHDKGLATDFATEIAALDAACHELTARIMMITAGPEIARALVPLHQQVNGINDLVQRLSIDAKKDVLAKAEAFRAQERNLRAAMSGTSITMLVLIMVAMGFALHLWRNHAAADAAQDDRAAQERFLATMNHELRTPLHGLRAALDLLRRQPLSETALKLVESAQESCTHALKKTDTALDAMRDADSAPPLVPNRSAVVQVMGKSALVVDDAQINCTLVAQMLGMLGFRVDTAFCGEQAVTQAMTNAYGLILMDFQMPGISGPAAAERIKSSGASTHAAIIGITAQIDAIAEAAQSGHFAHFLVKPFGLADLEACLSLGAAPIDPASFAPSDDEMALLRATLEMCGEALGMALLHDTLGLAAQALAEVTQDPARAAETAHRAAGAAMMAGFHELGAALRALEVAAGPGADANVIATLRDGLASATAKAQATLREIAALRDNDPPALI